MADYRLLVIGGLQAGINSSPEFNSISRLLRVQVLSGDVSYDNIYSVCLRDGPFDGIHILGDMSEELERVGGDHFYFSQDRSMDEQQVASIVGAARCKFLFLNACRTARVGTYVALNSRVEAVVYTTIPIEDARAWEMPERFYRALSETQGRTEEFNYDDLFVEAVSAARDGKYSIISLGRIPETINVARELRLIKSILVQIRQQFEENLRHQKEPSSGLGNLSWIVSTLIYLSILGSLVLLSLTAARIIG